MRYACIYAGSQHVVRASSVVIDQPGCVTGMRLNSREYDRIHPRNMGYGVDRSGIAGLQAGQAGEGRHRLMQWHESIGYLVIALQAVDGEHAEKATWKKGDYDYENSSEKTFADWA